MLSAFIFVLHVQLRIRALVLQVKGFSVVSCIVVVFVGFPNRVPTLPFMVCV